ncbi:MAG: DUF2442 domain-containing protein [Deltaproteobacteria bacterium]|nr:DUF2442 domain-containing protein [Deltaproteobacteria bacterium]
MHRVTRVEVKQNYSLGLVFSDGTRGTVDLSDLAGRGVFALWEDYEVFRKVRIGEGGELLWEEQIDLCPDSLYLKATGKAPDEVFPGLRHESVHA